MKKFMLAFIMISASTLSVANDEILKVCLTGSIEKAIPKYGESFFNGAKLAMDELTEENSKRVEIVYEPHDTTPLAPLRKLNELRKNGCDAIVGFSTGNDLASIEGSLKKDNVFTLSIYGDPQPHFTKTAYLRTMQPTADSLVQYLFKNLKLKSNSKILVVTAIDRSEMTAYREAYLKHLKVKNARITHVEVLEQAKDLTQIRNLLKQNSKWDYAVLLTRSGIAAEVSDLLYEHSTPILLGTKYMGSSELPAFYNFLKYKKITLYFARQNCTCSSSPDYQKLVNKYVAKFHVPPMAISIDTYDAVSFILKALKQKVLTPRSVIDYLSSSQATFNGASTLTVKPGLQLEVRSRFVIKVDESGYKEMK
jgi:Periplasmic binding protein